MKKNLYYFGWLSNLGGADTKIVHLIDLLHREYNITVIPNRDEQLQQKIWTQYLDERNVKYCSFESLPLKLTGIGFSFCNSKIFINKKIEIIKNKGLKFIWSSEMSYPNKWEMEAITMGLVDKVLCVSDIQKEKLKYPKSVPCMITENYINPDFFPFKKREKKSWLTIGRLSRADVLKYPENFPNFYEALEIPNVKFRVMGWNEKLKEKYKWHNFDNRWSLLKTEEESQVNFLHSLDFFIYPLGHNVIESWGRSTVEAMLTGCIPFVQTGHHFENLILHGVSGYICDDIIDYQKYLKVLTKDFKYRAIVSKKCREYAVNEICNKKNHLRIWKEALDV
jgi:hypothetical protein